MCEIFLSLLFQYILKDKRLVKTSMKVVSEVADSVLALSVSDENAISIKTRQLSMTLGRHSPVKLVGLEIKGGDGRFLLPDSQSLVPEITVTSFVDTQVRTQYLNLKTCKDQTPDTLSIILTRIRFLMHA